MPAALDELIDPVATAYRTGWERIQRELATVIDNPREFRRARRLREIQERVRRELGRLDRQAAPAARSAAGASGQLGFGTGATMSGATVIQFDLIDREALRRVSGGLYRDLLEATNNVDRTTRRFLRAVHRDVELDRLIRGRTATDAARRMRDLASANEVYAVRYANGARVGLGPYAEMAVRTVSGETYNGGLVDGAVAEGVGWFEIFDGPDCGLEFHDDGTVADGMIVDDTTARTYLLSHPNCRRSYGARPDIRNAEEAAAGGRSTTLAQREDQIAADVARQLPMSQRGIDAAQPQVRERRASTADRRGYRAARDGA